MYIPLFTITLVRTASFTIYTNVKDQMYGRGLVAPNSIQSSITAGFVGGAASGLLLSCGTSAFEFQKIRLQLEYLVAMKKGVPYEPRGTVQGFLDLYRQGGMRGLYTGFRLHALRDTLGTGLYFSFYDTASRIIAQHPNGVLPHIVTTFACGSAAGIASWALICTLRPIFLPLGDVKSLTAVAVSRSDRSHQDQGAAQCTRVSTCSRPLPYIPSLVGRN